MSVAAAHEVVRSYGARTVLTGLDLEVPERARIGVIGPNGGGKSTLLRLLSGMDGPDGGRVTHRKGVVTAYLAQQIGPDARTPVELARAARPDIARIEQELAGVSERLGSPEVAADMGRMERVLRRQEDLLAELERAGGLALEGRARALLRDVGLEQEALDRPTADLSGGQRKLAALGACLIRSPDLLLLDEPETHLDADRRGDLERLVQGFDGAVVMVSHDRYLLDETVRMIAELDRGKITLWPGTYSEYAVAREIAMARQQELYVTQQKEIARLEEAIRRFRHWAHIEVNERHIKQARVKQRQIDRMEKIERPVLERRKVGLTLRSEQRGGQRVVELRAAVVGFDDTPVVDGVDLTVVRGERVGVIGANGSGKSALARTLVGDQPLLGGERWIGPSIQVGHLAQEPSIAVTGATPLDAVRRLRPIEEGAAVQLLMRFLFNYEQVRQPLSQLSGGERTRLELLLLMRSGANLLVLDEPTNHLDIDSSEVLEDAIERYDGTVVFVSHDRYFLDRIADRIVEVRDGGIHVTEGGYSDWHRAGLRGR
jgi:ATP-binding cassette subfamily F protein 3